MVPWAEAGADRLHSRPRLLTGPSPPSGEGARPKEDSAMSRANAEAPSAPGHLKSEEVPRAPGLPTPPAEDVLQIPPPFGGWFAQGTASFYAGLHRPAWELEAVRAWLADCPGGFERKPVSTSVVRGWGADAELVVVAAVEGGGGVRREAAASPPASRFSEPRNMRPSENEDNWWNASPRQKVALAGEPADQQ